MGKKRSNPNNSRSKSKSTFGGLGGVLAVLKGQGQVEEKADGLVRVEEVQGEKEKEKADGVEVVRVEGMDEERIVKRRRVDVDVEVERDEQEEEEKEEIQAEAALLPSGSGQGSTSTSVGVDGDVEASTAGASTSTQINTNGVVISRKVVQKKKRSDVYPEHDEVMQEEKGKGKGKEKPLVGENEGLRKYFYQRYKLFSLYSSPPGCLLDDEGWYSVTPEAIAARIAERCRCDTILDAFCGVGGNAIQFALRCNRVIAMDTNATRLALARHNAMIYGVEERIEFVLGDYVQFAKGSAKRWKDKRKIDVVFLSPPWGGPDYLDGVVASEEQHALYSLSSIQPIHGAELFKMSREMTPNVAYYLPRNMDLDEVGKLVGEEEGYVEVEEEWSGTKLKALTCYFGGLVAGQEKLW
ncbi:hypothetical protein D9758_013136 [Tetrapyrgos nigripes]|uniref:Trimethylguanosine synthase n=1 Tax=Tetrapyrgos nigripes TaxID=182062 RepID=A0A8H5CE44_9AGAR|nr:hypothetical protein D9758_013136 [Tetrapyrgos nigripes]